MVPSDVMVEVPVDRPLASVDPELLDVAVTIPDESLETVLSALD